MNLANNPDVIELELKFSGFLTQHPAEVKEVIIAPLIHLNQTESGNLKKYTLDMMLFIPHPLKTLPVKENVLDITNDDGDLGKRQIYFYPNGMDESGQFRRFIVEYLPEKPIEEVNDFKVFYAKIEYTLSDSPTGTEKVFLVVKDKQGYTQTPTRKSRGTKTVASTTN